MSEHLRDRVAIVTGSTKGLGYGIAARFIAEGARVVINSRDRDACDHVAKAFGPAALPVPGDVGTVAACEALVAAAIDSFGRLDIVVNNAGVARDNFLTKATDERWRESVATNLDGPFYLTRAAVRHMKDHGGGAILNLVSWAGIRGNVGQAAYSASKAGLYGLTLSCAKELGKFGIRVNALAPAVATDMTVDMPDRLKQEVARRRPLKLEGTPDDVAEAALFLVSDRARFITGELLNVDGGMHLN